MPFTFLGWLHVKSQDWITGTLLKKYENYSTTRNFACVPEHLRCSFWLSHFSERSDLPPGGRRKVRPPSLVPLLLFSHHRGLLKTSSFGSLSRPLLGCVKTDICKWILLVYYSLSIFRVLQDDLCINTDVCDLLFAKASRFCRLHQNVRWFYQNLAESRDFENDNTIILKDRSTSNQICQKTIPDLCFH